MMSTASDNDQNGDHQEKNKGRKKRNLCSIYQVFICVYTSFNVINNLQSSINTDKNVGLYSLAFLSIASIVGAACLTVPIIYIAGYKWTIIAGQVGMLAYVAANMYPKAALLYPMAIICGIFRVNMWTAQRAYITVLGADENEHGDSETKVPKYFGIFYSAFQTAQIWGNLVAYFILKNRSQSSNNESKKCGADFLGSEQQSSNNDHQISTTTMYILCGVFSVIIVISIILAILFLDQKRKLEQDNSTNGIRKSFDFFLQLLRQMINPYHLLLAPIAIWTNAAEAFIFAIYTKGFITCTLSIQYVGLIMMSYGITATIVSGIYGYTAGLKHSRLVWFLLASALSYTIYIVMLVWEPKSSQTYVLYILACIAGFTCAILKPLASALYGLIFVDSKEIAFSIDVLYQNLGYVAVYFYASVLRIRISIILQIIYVSVATICYIIVEFRQHKLSKTSESTVLSSVVMFPRQTSSADQVPQDNKISSK